MELVVFLCLVGLSYYGVKCFRNYALKKDIIDHPNHRSSHLVATPRGGGIVVAGLWLLCSVLFGWFYHVDLSLIVLFFIPGMLIAIIGLLDDLWDLSVLLRAAIHSIAALFIVVVLLFCLGSATFSILTVMVFIISVFTLVWSINLFNFMDGLDGFASLMAIFYFMVGGYLAYHAESQTHYLSFLAWALVALLLGFLGWNKPKAKIFLGDGGSSFLGLIVAIFALVAIQQLHITFLLWIYLYGVFLFDATITLLRRIAKGEKWYQSHRLHAYQRLHQSGFSHAQILGIYAVINVFISALVLWAYFKPEMLLWNGLIELVLLFGIYCWIECRKPMYGNKND